MKILITGGNSFIGRSLLEVLGPKYSITSLNRSQLDLLNTNNVAECLKQNRFDIVIHSATYDAAPVFSTKDPALVLENNLKMFFNISRCNNHFGKMIYFGSGAEFGRDNWTPKMSEEYFDCNVPSDQYGLSKYTMTKHALLSDNIYNLRLFGVFGKYDDWRYRLIPNLCSNAARDLPLVINQNRSYDFLYIDDLIKIIDWFIQETPKHKVYNVCSGKIYDFLTVANKINQISNKNLDISVKQSGMGIEYSGDNSLLMQEMTDFQFTSIDDSIRDLYRWYEVNQHIFQEK